MMKKKMNPSQSARSSSGFTSTILEKSFFISGEHTRLGCCFRRPCRKRLVPNQNRVWRGAKRATPGRVRSPDSFLLFPRGENLRFALSRNTGAQLRLSILRERFKPDERVTRRVGQRTKRQTFAQPATDARSGEAALFSSPHRHIRPRLDFLLRKKFLAHPDEVRIRFPYVFNSIEHCADAERLRRAGCVINSGLMVFTHSNRPLSQIASVDELDRIIRISRGKHFAASIDSDRPIGKAIGLIAWTDNQARTNNQRLSGKPFLGLFFRKRLQWSVGFVTGRLHRFECLLVRIRAFVFLDRRRLIDALLHLAINRNRRNKNVAIDVPLEKLRSVAHPGR